MSTSAPRCWQVRLDRRSTNTASVRQQLSLLADGVQGLRVDLLTDQDIDDAPDQGAFRDFVPIARITHSRTEVLEYVAEDLLETFGWQVDFKDLSA